MNKLFVFAAAILFFSAVRAETQEVDGVVWKFTVISNSVTIGDFPNTNCTAAISCDVAGEITIPDTLAGLPVVDITPYAFAGCTNITDVTIPDTVTNIGKAAFAGGFIDPVITGYYTTTITSNGTTTQIFTPMYQEICCGDGCHNLTKLTLPKSLKIIGALAFAGCENLSSVTFRGSVEIIGGGAFLSCRRLEKLELPEGLGRLGSSRGTIVGYTAVTTTSGGTTTQTMTPVYNGEDASYSEKGVFEGCVSLSSLNIPASVSTIRNYAFANCVSLKALNFAGDKPSVNGTSLLVGTPGDLIVNVKNEAKDWYDPITYGHLSVWQHRLVAYDGVFYDESTGMDDDEAIDLIQSAINIIQTLGSTMTEQDRLAYLQYIQGIVDRHPMALSCIASAMEVLGVKLSDSEKEEFSKWAFSVTSARLTPPAESSDDSIGSTDGVLDVLLTVTNVVMHYVVNSITPDLAVPITNDMGIVTVMPEIKGGAIAVPDSWVSNYPTFKTTFGSDFVAALTKSTGKLDAGGKPMLVWQDFVAGTDPTDVNDKFTASVTIVDGKPVVSWTPELPQDQAALRTYTIYGKKALKEADWSVVNGDEDNYNFFKVTVEMK